MAPWPTRWCQVAALWLVLPCLLPCPVVAKRAGGKAAGKFSQNCASLKQCNRPMSERDPAMHRVKEGAPEGHLMPLGHAAFDKSWLGEIDSVTDMSPETFWTKYWPHTPFVLRGWGKQSRAFEFWQDDDYLVKNFGKFKVKCEPKNEDRLTDYCDQVKLGSKVRCPDSVAPYVESRMTLAKFSANQHRPSFDKYIVTQMPDPMAKDVQVPPLWFCGARTEVDRNSTGAAPWQTQAYEHNFWWSKNDGNNFSTSVIHFDMNHQLMCNYAGSKQWFMWDLRTEREKIPMWSNYYRGGGKAPEGSDDSPVDGERVDLEKWPRFGDAGWKNVTLNPGDCLYTPAHLLHYVRSYGRNIAAMTMFQTSERFDPKTCHGYPSSGIPLSQFDPLWQFPGEDPSLLGWNMIKMGFPHWKKTWRARFLSQMWPVAAKQDEPIKLARVRQWFVRRGESTPEWGRRVDERLGLADAALGGTGLFDKRAIIQSKEMRFLFKDLAVHLEGGDAEMDEGEKRVYSLHDPTKTERGADLSGVEL